MNINEIIGKYTSGAATASETNAALAAIGSTLYIDPNKNVIAPDEVDRYGLLDTGTGSLDKVEIRDGHLVDTDCGEMDAWVVFGGVRYRVRGTVLEAE